MLQQLSIQNFAIIDELKVDFQPQLNTITGETGAGKSILLGALGLVLGNRADSSSLQNSEKKCIVEAVFSTATHKKVNTWLKENEIDLVVSPEAFNWLAEVGYDPFFGARPVKRVIQKNVLNELSKAMLSGTIDKTQPVVSCKPSSRKICSEAKFSR